jgi:SAM-dependent methyltransferase
MLLNKIRSSLPPHTREAIYFARNKRSPIIAALVRQYCTGQGIEIGAGKTPYGDPSRTTFLDKNVGDKDSTENADIVADANAIPRPDASFDYVLSSHVLEHVPNTIKTLNEWLRVLKPGGVMFTILPHAERTIDRFRRVTTLEHHLEDFANGIDDTDRTHFEEMKAGWLQLPGAGEEDAAQYKREWGADLWDWDFRIKHSVLHYHVWTQDEIVRLYQHLGLKIAHVAEIAPEREDSFIVVARKPL